MPETTEIGRGTEHTVEQKYVAFCDILGFSNSVVTEFDQTLSLYISLAQYITTWEYSDQVNVTMYSDSILITSSELPPLLGAVQLLWFYCLQNNFMLRGGIAFGKYWEDRRDTHLLMVSDALINAVKLEKMVGVPAVVISDDIVIPENYWFERFQNGPYASSLLHFRDRNIVNPFNPAWGTSAAMRARLLMEKSPTHSNKYLWFLALYDALKAGNILIPEATYQSFIDRGILAFVPSESQPETRQSNK
ncbi:hypothetical protein [Glaciimonas soli]|uniref:Guanylate cyclase domain-containing protein n=1 Tax=Glaciimonas soli TaxID=2590999 RepID=A0A843YS65_9BURK|nr:hypothetical protein [Glaciimonas soli]MQR02579.1 hypothetical protein [Glaciimonas soli]